MLSTNEHRSNNVYSRLGNRDECDCPTMKYQFISKFSFIANATFETIIACEEGTMCHAMQVKTLKSLIFACEEGICVLI